jgi:hypothetical protein
MKILDHHFSHAVSAGNPFYDTTLPFKWQRTFNYLVGQENIFFTDSTFYESLNLNYSEKILWVLESPSLISETLIKDICACSETFKNILTHDDRLIHLKNAICFPIGGCWIYENDSTTYEKEKNTVSMIISDKKNTQSQIMRHQIASLNKTINFGPSYTKIDYKLDGLKKFKYHVCVENIKTDFYFSEKIIDCFATGTIPIYFGCNKIDNFFNKDGILCFDNISEVEFILNHIDLIDINKNVIEENYELSKKYWLPENRILQLFPC